MSRAGGDRLGIAVLAVGIAALALGRCWLAGALDPAPDEAWYWLWSKSLSLVYPDHPPAVAYLIRLGTALLGDTGLGIRAATIALGLIGTVLLFALGRELGLLAPRAAAGALLGSLLPVPAAGGLLATPDAPLGVVWIAATLLLARIARTKEPRAGQWILLGLLTGAGLWAKHSALLLPLAAAALLALQGRLLAQVVRPGPWLGLGAAALLAAPYLVGEIIEGLPSIGLQAAHLAGALPGGGATGIAGLLERPGGLLAGQIGLLGPVLFAILAWIAVRRAWRRPELTAVLVAIVTPMAATLVAALFTHPEQNWASLGHPLAPPVALAAMAHARRTGAWSRSKERVVVTALVITVLAASMVVHVHAARPFLPLPPERDPVSRLHGWAGLSREIGALEAALGAEAWLCDDYGLAAALVLDLAGQGVPVLSTDRPWPGPTRFDRALLLDLEDDWAAARPEVDCASVGPPVVVERRRADGAVVGRVTARPAGGCAIR